MRPAVFAILILLCPLLLSPLWAKAQPIVTGELPKGIEIPIKLELKDVTNITIHPNGVADIRERIKATATGFLFLKQQYPTGHLFKRFILLDKTNLHIENISISFDDVNNRVDASYRALGMAAKRDGVWEVKLEGEMELVAQAGNRLVFNFVFLLPLGGTKVTTINLNLPEGAELVGVEREGIYTVVRYRLEPASGLPMGVDPILIALGAILALLVMNAVVEGGIPSLLRRRKG